LSLEIPNIRKGRQFSFAGRLHLVVPKRRVQFNASGSKSMARYSKVELLITIMSSLAQEESRSISENVTWGKRKQMADGKFTLPFAQFLGYKRGEDGLPEIVPEEAEVVQLIYQLYMEGKTFSGIARFLTKQGIPTPAGKKNWQRATVRSILTNEKYKGDSLLQKHIAPIP